MATECLSVFSFDGKINELNYHSKLLDLRDINQKEILWKEIPETIQYNFNHGLTDDNSGYLIAHDFEGGLIIHNNQIVFGNNQLETNGLKSLFEKIEDLDHEEIVEKINHLLNHVYLSDFNTFQLIMLKVFYQAYLGRFEDNIRTLFDLDNRYQKFDDETKDLIKNAKLNRYQNQDKFVDSGHFRFDFAYLQFSFGYNYQMIGERNLALDYYDKAYEIWKNKNNSLFSEEKIKILTNYAVICHDNQNYKISIEYNNKAVRLLEENNGDFQQQYLLILQNLALTYRKLMNLEKSLQLASQAYNLAKSSKNENLQFLALTNLGFITKHFDLDKAKVYFNKAYKLFNPTNMDRSHLAHILFQLSLININTGNIDDLLSIISELEVLSDSLKYNYINDQLLYLKLYLKQYNIKFEKNKIYSHIFSLFKDSQIDIEIRILYALDLLEFIFENKSTKLPIEKIKEVILSFAKKYKVTSLIELIEDGKHNIMRLKIYQIPLIEYEK